MGYLGEKLRDAREKKGVTLQDAAIATKIKTGYLRSLEEEDYDQLPPRAYVKGFLKIYAKYLALDYALLIDLYKESYEIPDAQMVFSSRKPSSVPLISSIKWKSLAGAVGVVIVVALLILGGSRLLRGRSTVTVDSVHFARVDNPYTPETIERIPLDDNILRGK